MKNDDPLAHTIAEYAYAASKALRVFRDAVEAALRAKTLKEAKATLALTCDTVGDLIVGPLEKMTIEAVKVAREDDKRPKRARGKK
jgi:hypothetical protein